MDFINRAKLFESVCKIGSRVEGIRELPFFELVDKDERFMKKQTYNREYTPNNISSLQPNEIFVFGSNISGMHGSGAAKAAYNHFGAEWGVGEGLTGQCYALPTMEGGVDYIANKVQKFLAFAKTHPELRFYVTKIACGIAGFTVEEIGPLFADAIEMNNVILPKEFVESIN